MKDAKEPFLILLVLFILVGLAYGPMKKSRSDNADKKTNTSSTIGAVESKNLNTNSNKETAEKIKEISKDVKSLNKEVKKLNEQKTRSPYYGKMGMSGVYGLNQNDPSKEYISLSTYLEKGETLKITGWYLKSAITGYYAIIGGAALLPFPFTKTESDVILGYRDRVYLTKGFSPIGISFRTNKCTGYFEENRTFTPSLSKRCPRPKDEKLPVFSDVYDRNDECVEIIERIPRCATKGPSFIRSLPDTVPESCKKYITTQINYNTCVALHFGDIDFPDNEYRIYLNKFGPLWRQTHDTINLHDENGLIVDTINY